MALSNEAAVVIFWLVRLLSALYSNISDCDETYNYWEPTHFLLYGEGFQTWEYSPVYAIRSYGYLLLHAIPVLITNTSSKVIAFYLVRVSLATVSALCEVYFCRAVYRKYGSSVGLWTLLLLLGSCGMYVSAAAYLPSSFAMYLTMVAMGAWFENNYKVSIMAVAASAIVGWPFSAALGLPLALELIFFKRKLLLFVKYCVVAMVTIAGPLFIIDTLYYGKAVFTPLNILLYNVFGGGGPDLYGVEPWTFYFFNGLLNFNGVFVLAMATGLLVETKVLVDMWLTRDTKQGYTCSSAYRAAVQPLLVWVVIFFTQAHKEERFLFPVYPLFALNAAISLHLLQDTTPFLCVLVRAPKVLNNVARSCVRALPAVVVIVHALLSLSRAVMLYKGYHAPLDLYASISTQPILSRVRTLDEVNLCVGKEWYRVPSSFFLPDKRWKLRFIRSDFRGQLPKPYSSFKNATSAIPDSMNDMNQEEPSRYFDLSRCHFLVDLDIPVDSEREPRYAQDSATWEVLVSYPFLDAGRSSPRYRTFYIPWFSDTKVSFANYVLLKNRKLVP